MSYEILLYPRTPGQDWEQVIAADEADGPAMDQATLNRGVATFRRIEARLREQLTEPVRTWVAEDLDGDVFGELQSRDSRLRVDLYDRSASVSIPYGGPDAPGHDLARTAVEIVTAETGYAPYDPQVGAAFEGHFDDQAGQASLAQPAEEDDDLWADERSGGDGGDGAAGATAGGAAGGDTAEGTAPLEGQVLDPGASGAGPGSPGSSAQDGPLDARAERQRLLEERRRQLEERRRDPAALRRRGWFYLIFGVLLTVLGLMRLAEGDTSLLTWLFLGIGVFELFGGYLMFGQSRLMAQRKAEEGQGPEVQDTVQDDAPDGGPEPCRPGAPPPGRRADRGLLRPAAVPTGRPAGPASGPCRPAEVSSCGPRLWVANIWLEQSEDDLLAFAGTLGAQPVEVTFEQDEDETPGGFS